MRSSKKDEASPGEGAKLTRGEFIGAGAAAAAAATVPGLAGGTEARAEERPVTGGQQCAPQCPPRERTWEIPAGILNAFWGDIFPRLVAKHWAGTLTDPAGNPNPGLSLIDMDETDLQYQLSDAFWLDPAAPTCDPTADPTCYPTAEFRRRLELVRVYFQSAGATLIPIRVLGDNGFDFVLSDQGLDIFLPPEPRDLLEVSRYYVFRRSGRPALGFPFYMTDGTASLLMDAPTGPGQVRVDVSAVLDLVVDNTEPRCADELLECLRVRIGEDRRLELTLEEYQCILAPYRCWQISGSVYRGIMNELPRVVAQIWFEEMTCGQLGPSYYASRFEDPGNDGLRGIFAERLETSLPDPGQMHFEAFGPPDPAADVLITNQGFRVPKYPDPSLAVLDDIYREIALGKAGNPVFTDSKQTH